MTDDIRIIIVDDDVIVRENLVAFLEDEDFDVYAVKDAEEGLKLVEDIDFHVAIVDMRLPGEDGSRFILKMHRKQPKTRFIIHTGSTNFTLPDALKKIGVTRDELFMKPIRDMNSFVKEINRLIDE